MIIINNYLENHDIEATNESFDYVELVELIEDTDQVIKGILKEDDEKNGQS